MKSFYDVNGDKVFVGRELGRGGEGTVFEIEGEPQLVAKIYHERISSDKAEKLLRMKALQNEKLLRVTAWATEVLRDSKNGEIVGFVMPKLKSGTAIHELYNPKSRRQFFPEADWRFLIHTATNLARAFSVIHSHGHAIGDVNHGNIVIAKDATVKLIDCDSYQLNAPQTETDKAQNFLCEVGVSTHTPPELQGKSLRDVTRTANHDDFGLAVLIFQLLFMGRHPFSGEFLGEDETTLEDSIRENRFAYGGDAESRLIRQPPATLSLSAVTPTVAELFRRAFLVNENRPTAQNWIDALEKMSDGLKQCHVNASHFYSETSKKCSWCSLEIESGIAFYPVKLGDDFDIVTIGRLIDTIKPPEIKGLAAKNNQSKVSGKLSVSPEVQSNLSDFHFSMGVFQVFWVFLTLAVSTFIPIQISLIFVIASYFVCEELMKSLLGDLLQKAQLKLDNARQKRNSFHENYKSNSLIKPFETLRGELKTTIKTYQNLPQEREFLVKSYGKQRYQKQLEIYLQNHSVSDSKLQGLTDNELENLRTKNIISAADIKKENFLWLPNFNFALKIKLFDWRSHLEKAFVFELTEEILKREYEEINTEIAEKRLKLESEIKNGLPRLQQNISQISINQQLMIVESEKLSDQYRTTEFDFEIITKRRQFAIILTVLLTLASFTIGTIGRNFYNYQPNEVGNSIDKMVLPKMTPATSGYKVEPRGINGGDIGLIKSDKFQPTFDLQNATAEEIYNEGQRLYKSGKLADAIVYFETVEKKSPKDSNLQYMLGVSYFGVDDYTNAAKHFENIFPTNSKSAALQLISGTELLKKGENDEAIKVLIMTANLNPKSCIFYYHLGITLKEAKRYKEAILYLKKGLKLNQSYQSNFRKEISLCNEKLGDETNAKSDLRKSENSVSPIMIVQ